MSKRGSDSCCSSPASKSKTKRRNRMDDSPSSVSSSSSNTPRETDWRPCSRDVISVNERMLEGVSPREILLQLVPDLSIDNQMDDGMVWQIIVNLLTEPPLRSKLTSYNTMDDAIHLLRSCSKIIILTGAGVSVSCGIPDFRSRNGIYARLRKDFPDLPSPEAMFDLEYFRKNPKPFYEFAKEIFPGQYQPSLCHRFVKALESHGKLLRNYTQNIDVLENIAGIERVVQCHGSFATASCCVCKHKVECHAVKDAIFEKAIPRCPNCPPEVELNIMKPDIVFFGEDLPGEFHERFNADKEEVDLLIVIGSSLKVRPVALVPNCIPPNVPQILINREPLEHLNFDIELLGNCDSIVAELCHRLGDEWGKLNVSHQPLRETVLSESQQHAVAVKPVSKHLQPPSFKRSRHHVKPKKPRKKQFAKMSSETGESSSSRQTPDIAELRKMYKPRLRNLATDLDDNAYLFVSPNRYVFPGAEVFVPWDEDDDDSNSSTTSASISSSTTSPSVDHERAEVKEESEGVVMGEESAA